MSHKRPRNVGLWPKQNSIKRKSVSSHSAADWIQSFLEPNKTVPRSTSIRRTDNRFISNTSLLAVTVGDRDEEDEIHLSPASSPEDSFLTGLGHELFGIEAAEVEATPLRSTEMIIPEIVSLPSSQHSSTDTREGDEGNIVEQTQPPRSIPLNHTDINKQDEGGEGEMDYLHELHRDTMAPPYLDLSRKPRHERQTKSTLVSRLRLLTRRLCSERAIWLHQHSAHGNLSSDHTHLVFRIREQISAQFCHLPGLAAYRVVALRPSEKASDDESNLPSLTSPNPERVSQLILPVSGQLENDATVLGDCLQPNDVIRVYSPWSSLCSPTQMDQCTLFGFFWVERVRPREVERWMEVIHTASCPNPTITPSPSVFIGCKCLETGTRAAVISCPNRFPNLDDVETLKDSDKENASSTGLDRLDADLRKWRNPILVLDKCEFWISRKQRQALLILHHISGLGYVLLPTNESTNVKLKPGCVYATERLLQLPPDSQLSDSAQQAALSRYDEIRKHLDLMSLTKLSHFSSSMRDEPINVSDNHPKAQQHHQTLHGISRALNTRRCGLWDARVATFTRAQAGDFLCLASTSQGFQIPDGALSKSAELGRLDAWNPTAVEQNSHRAHLSHILPRDGRVWYVLLQRPEKTFVVACVGTLDALTPLDRIDPILRSKSVGMEVHLEEALIGPGCLLIDAFTRIQTVTQTLSPGNATAVLHRLLPTVSTRMNSIGVWFKLRLHDLILFSGKLIKVLVDRSHAWPACPQCLSADLRTSAPPTPREGESEKADLRANPPMPTRFICHRCSTRVNQPLPMFELEVYVDVKTTTNARVPNEIPPRLVLNMSPARMLRMLGQHTDKLPENVQFDPKKLLSQPLEDVYGLIIQISPPSGTQNTKTLRQMTVLEIDTMPSQYK